VEALETLRQKHYRKQEPLERPLQEATEGVGVQRVADNLSGRRTGGNSPLWGCPFIFEDEVQSKGVEIVSGSEYSFC